MVAKYNCIKDKCSQSTSTSNHKHELHLWSLHFSFFMLCQVVFIFKFVALSGWVSKEWLLGDTPRIAYTFALNQAHIYCVETGNNSSMQETTLKTNRRLQIVSKFLIVVSKKEVGIKVYKFNEFKPSTRTKMN